MINKVKDIGIVIIYYVVLYVGGLWIWFKELFESKENTPTVPLIDDIDLDLTEVDFSIQCGTFKEKSLKQKT